MVDLVYLRSKESSRKLRFVIFYFTNPSFSAPLPHTPSWVILMVSMEQTTGGVNTGMN